MGLHDQLSLLRRDYLKNPRPSNTQYGWVWEDKQGVPPTVPVGPDVKSKCESDA